MHLHLISKDIVKCLSSKGHGSLCLICWYWDVKIWNEYTELLTVTVSHLTPTIFSEIEMDPRENRCLIQWYMTIS